MARRAKPLSSRKTGHMEGRQRMQEGLYCRKMCRRTVATRWLGLVPAVSGMQTPNRSVALAADPGRQFDDLFDLVFDPATLLMLAIARCPTCVPDGPKVADRHPARIQGNDHLRQAADPATRRRLQVVGDPYLISLGSTERRPVSIPIRKSPGQCDAPPQDQDRFARAIQLRLDQLVPGSGRRPMNSKVNPAPPMG
jgi:hypothetical protein